MSHNICLLVSGFQSLKSLFPVTVLFTLGLGISKSHLQLDTALTIFNSSDRLFMCCYYIHSGLYNVFQGYTVFQYLTNPKALFELTITLASLNLKPYTKLSAIQVSVYHLHTRSRSQLRKQLRKQDTVLDSSRK